MRFIPFLGSSEWVRFDSMHPAVLAEKYNRPYRPYFLGQAGATSLIQIFWITTNLAGNREQSGSICDFTPVVYKDGF